PGSDASGRKVRSGFRSIRCVNTKRAPKREPFVVYRTLARAVSGEFRLQFLEFRELFGQEIALLVAAHEHLEHALALAVEELHGAGAAAMEQAVDQKNLGAVRRLDVTADRAVAMDVEIAVPGGAGGQTALDLRDDDPRMDKGEGNAPSRQLRRYTLEMPT